MSVAQSHQLAIEIQNLSISFDGVCVLDSVDFSVQKGDVHGIVGKNGAGKSTLMKVLTGINKPKPKTIKIFGQSFDAYSVKEANQSKISMVYQDLSLVSSMPIYQNIFLSNNPYQKNFILNDKKSKIESANLLKKLGVPDLDPNLLVNQISVGHAQIVEIAKALSTNPKILILDEPTASLTNQEIKTLFQAISLLKKQGITILYITHYLDDVIQICDKVTVLRDGKIVSSSEVKDASIEWIVSQMLGSQKFGSKHWNKKSFSYNNQIPLLELRNIKSNSINNISLKVYPGEIIGLAGLLGSGRTELLSSIYGLDKIQSGEILISGKEVRLKNTEDALNSKISLVPEERRTQGLITDFTVVANLVLSILSKITSYFFLKLRKENDLADYFIKYLDIKAESRKQIVRYLSGGNQQKIVVGKCLASDSKILLLDDPTAGIDVQSKVQIMKIVKEYVKKGNCVIFVSPEFQEIVRFCDRVYIMKKRQIINEIYEQDLNEEKLLQEVQ